MESVKLLTLCSKLISNYKAPPKLLQMIKGMRASRAGVVVLSCSDPRLNPYQILGLDETLSTSDFQLSFSHV